MVNGVITFLVLGILLVLPIVTLAMVVRLCRTIGDRCVAKGERAGPWSCRLYSAAKRAVLAWVSEIVFCVVVFLGLGYYDSSFLPVRCHYWLMLALPVVAFTWGVMNPRVYSDGAERVKNRVQLPPISTEALIHKVPRLSFALPSGVHGSFAWLMLRRT